jgi:hypothetical protein
VAVGDLNRDGRPDLATANSGSFAGDPGTVAVLLNIAGSSSCAHDADCDDLNLCSDDSCGLYRVCVHVNNTAPCDDENVCTTGDACRGGMCHAGGPTNCDDGTCCTIDSCENPTGCVHVAYTAPPVFTTQPSFGNLGLWPPEHGYADFSVASTGAVVSTGCAIASIQFASCASSQPENSTGVGDGNTWGDCTYEPDSLHVRAERDGACSPIGRVYTMTLVALDVCGNSTVSSSFDIGVWHDRGHSPRGPFVGATPGSGTSDTRPGNPATYGVSCGAGIASTNGSVHDHSDADPEMEIAQNASVSVGDLQVNKGTGGTVLLSWSLPVPGTPTPAVTRFHVYRLEPATLFWTLIAELDETILSYQDPSLNDGQSWQYKVTALIK